MEERRGGGGGGEDGWMEGVSQASLTDSGQRHSLDTEPRAVMELHLLCSITRTGSHLQRTSTVSRLLLPGSTSGRPQLHICNSWTWLFYQIFTIMKEVSLEKPINTDVESVFTLHKMFSPGASHTGLQPLHHFSSCFVASRWVFSG